MKKTDQHILKAVFALLAILIFLPTAGALAEDIVSLNKATVEELLAIEDLELDEEIANAIVQYRLKNGEFKEPDDLLKVPGMDEDWFEEINPVVLDGDIVYDPDAEGGEAAMKAY